MFRVVSNLPATFKLFLIILTFFNVKILYDLEPIVVEESGRDRKKENSQTNNRNDRKNNFFIYFVMILFILKC